MKKTISLENLVNDPGCLSEYDPNAMTIEVARKYIHDFLTVNLGTEYVNTEDALDRILGETLISKINVPNYNNSAMDGFAFNLDSLIEKNTLKVATTILAGDLSKQKIKARLCGPDHDRLQNSRWHRHSFTFRVSQTGK
jgi:molybdopterin molybdotransferase